MRVSHQAGSVSHSRERLRWKRTNVGEGLFSLRLPARHNVPPLPHSVQEHLGQMLRAIIMNGERSRAISAILRFRSSSIPTSTVSSRKSGLSGSCGFGNWVRRLLPIHSQVSISKAHPRGAEAVFLMTGTSRKVQIQRAFNVHGPERLILRSPLLLFRGFLGTPLDDGSFEEHETRKRTSRSEAGVQTSGA